MNDEILCFLFYGIVVVFIYLQLGVAFCRKNLISQGNSVLLVRSQRAYFSSSIHVIRSKMVEGLELFQTPCRNWFLGLCGNRFVDLCGNWFVGLCRNRFVDLCGNQFMGLCGNRFVGLCGNRFVGLCRNRFVGLCENRFVSLCGNRFVGLIDMSCPSGSSPSHLT